MLVAQPVLGGLPTVRAIGAFVIVWAAVDGKKVMVSDPRCYAHIRCLHCLYLSRTIVAEGSPTVLGFKLICQPKDSSARKNARRERQPDSA